MSLPAFAAYSEGVAPDENGVITVMSADDLNEAVNDPNVSTIKLGAIISYANAGADAVTVTRDLTLDLNGYEISCSAKISTNDVSTIKVTAGTLTVQDSGGNGTIRSTNTAGSAIKATTDGSLNFISGKIEAKTGIAFSSSKPASLKIEDGTFINGSLRCVYTSGTGPKTISGGTFELNGTSMSSYCIHVVDGPLTITGGTFDGGSRPAVYNKQGSVAIEGGEFKTNSTATTAAVVYNTDTLAINPKDDKEVTFINENPAGYALYQSCATTSKRYTDIYGGEFTGKVQVNHSKGRAGIRIHDGMFSGDFEVGTNGVTLTISGGHFAIRPDDAYVVETCEVMAGTIEGYPFRVAEPVKVAQIGNVKYATLAEAVAAVTTSEETTITMIGDSAEPNVITVAAGKDIVLDLAGHTVSYTTDVDNATTYFVSNKGTLTIQDSGSNGSIILNAPNVGYNSYETVTVYNIGGTLNLTSGTIKNASPGGLAYAVNNSSNAWGQNDDKETVFNMSGGTISAPNGDAALRVYQNCADTTTPYSHNTVNITGGTILDTGIFLDNYIYNPTSTTTGEGIQTNVTISDGTINGLIDMKLRHPFNTRLDITGGDFTNSKLWVRRHSEWNSVVAEPTAPLVNISGGKWSFVDGKAFGLAYDCDTTSWTSYSQPYSVTGGVFNVDLNTFSSIAFPAGKTGVANTAEATKDAYPYTVGVDTTYVAQIGETKYKSLSDAIKYAKAGDKIELIANVPDTDLTHVHGTYDDQDHFAPNVTVEGKAGITCVGIYFNSNDDDGGISGLPSGWTFKDINFVGKGLRTNHHAVTNLTVTGCTFTDGAVLHVTDKNATNIVVSNCTFTGVNATGSGGDSAIYIPKANGLTVQNCTIQDGSYNAIQAFPVAGNGDVTITGNTFSGINSRIINMKNVDDNYTGTITISGNTFNLPSTPKEDCNFIRVGKEIIIGENTYATVNPEKDLIDDYGYYFSSAPAAQNFYRDSSNENLWHIANLDGLKEFRDSVNSGETYAGKTVQLDADITMDNVSWVPIGSGDNLFKGTFDGNSNTISNLNINNSSLDYAGLFGKTGYGSTIKDLTLDSPSINARKFVGALAGDIWASTVNNVDVTGTIVLTGYHVIGGLAGQSSYTSITGCDVTGSDKATSVITGNYDANVEDGDNVGGLIGMRGPSDLAAQLIDVKTSEATSGCSVSNLTLNGWRKVGGLFGQAYDEASTYDCTVSNIDVIATASEEFASSHAGTMGFGGMVGIFAHYTDKEHGTETGNGNREGYLEGTVSNVNITSGTPAVNTYARMGIISGGLRDGNGIQVPGYVHFNVNVSGANSTSSPNVSDNTTAIYSAYTAPVTYVAQIVGGASYMTFDDAVAAAQTGDTVKLLTDVTFDENRSVPVWGKAFNLDLNGFTLTTNSGVDKDLSNMGYKASALCFAYEGETAVSVSNGEIRTAYGAGVYTAAEGMVTLSDLTVVANTVGVQPTAEYSSALRLTGGKATINSGSYTGNYVIAVSNTGGEVIVNGGTFTGDIFFSRNTNTGVTKSITINGGAFNGNFVNPNKGTLAISGGKFSVDPSDYLVTGYKKVNNTDGDSDTYQYKVVVDDAAFTNTVSTANDATVQKVTGDNNTTTTQTFAFATTDTESENVTYAIKVDTQVTDSNSNPVTEGSGITYQPVQTAVTNAGALDKELASNINMADAGSDTDAIAAVKVETEAAVTKESSTTITAKKDDSDISILGTQAAGNAFAKAAKTVDNNEQIKKAEIEMRSTLTAYTLKDKGEGVTATSVTVNIDPYAILKDANGNQLGDAVKLEDSDLTTEGIVVTFKQAVPFEPGTLVNVKHDKDGNGVFNLAAGDELLENLVVDAKQEITITTSYGTSPFTIERISETTVASGSLSTVNYVAGYTLTLNDRIDVNFYTHLTDAVASDSNSYMEITFAGLTNGHANQITKKISEMTTTTDGYYVFTYAVAPSEGDKAITLKLHTTNGILPIYDANGKAADNGWYTRTLNDVTKVAIDYEGDDNQSNVKDLTPLAKKLLAYSQYSQGYFSETDVVLDSRLVAPDVTAAQTALDANFVRGEVNLPNDVGYVGTTLVLDSETSIKIYLSGNVTGHSYSYFDGSDTYSLTPVKSGSRYYFKITNLDATKLNKKFAVYAGDTKIFDYSVLTWAQSLIGKSEAYKQNLAAAMYEYNVAARAYFGVTD